MFIQISERGVKEGFRRHPPTEAVKTEGGGIKWGKSEWRDLVSSKQSEGEKIALSAQWNSHPIAHELLVKCKCIPEQPRNKQAATSLAYN